MRLSAREDFLVGIEPERPNGGADNQQCSRDDERRLPRANLDQNAPNTIGEMAPPKLPAMFIIPDTVPEYLPPVSIGTAHDGPIVNSRKNIEMVRQ